MSPPPSPVKYTILPKIMDFRRFSASQMSNTIIYHNTMLVCSVGNQVKLLNDHFSLFFTFVQRGWGLDNLMNIFLFNGLYPQPFCELDCFLLFSDTIYVCP